MVDHNIFNLFFPLIMFFPLVGFTPPPPFSDPSPRFMCLREAAKKKVPPLMAGSLRGGGVVKAGPLRKKSSDGH